MPFVYVYIYIRVCLYIRVWMPVCGHFHVPPFMHMRVCVWRGGCMSACVWALGVWVGVREIERERERVDVCACMRGKNLDSLMTGENHAGMSGMEPALRGDQQR